MYEKIELEWPQDVKDWQNKDVVETPFIKLSDEEEVEIPAKHYKTNTGKCYTIVNDLATISKKLPRIPTIESIAIIRHKNTKVTNDYTYRPYVF